MSFRGYALAAILTSTLAAQTYTIRSIIGPETNGDGGLATAAWLGTAGGIDFDDAGNLLIAESRMGRVRRVDVSSAIITTIAGAASRVSAGLGGPATAAGLGTIGQIAAGPAGNIYLNTSDGIHRIRPDGVIVNISTCCGPNNGDGGPVAQARVNARGLDADATGRVYILTSDNLSVRRLETNGIIDVFFNTARFQAAFGTMPSSISDISLDETGNLYLVYADRIARVTPNGAATRLTNSMPDFPSAVAARGGKLYFGSTLAGGRVYRVQAGAIQQIAGCLAGGCPEYVGQRGRGTDFTLPNLNDLAVDPEGHAVAALANNLVVHIDDDGTIDRFAGRFHFQGDGGAAAQALANLADFGSGLGQAGIAVDNQGSVFFSDWGNRRVRKMDSRGVISTFAGNGADSGPAGDNGPATAAVVRDPGPLAADDRGNVFFATRTTRTVQPTTLRVLAVNAAGTIRPFAGGAGAQSTGDNGAATAAGFLVTRGIAAGPDGAVFVFDSARVRRIDPAGFIAPYAGDGRAGSSGDGGPATAAQIGAGGALAVDLAGTLYLVDGNRVRAVGRNGVIRTIAGETLAGFTGDGGPAAQARLNVPIDIAVFPPVGSGAPADGPVTIFILEGSGARIRRILPGGVIDTIAGTGQDFAAGDGGPALLASFDFPSSLDVDKDGNIYVTERNTSRIRKLEPVLGPVFASNSFVSAAAFTGGRFASDMFVALFGSNLASGLIIPESGLPASLGGTSVAVIDSAGVRRSARLQFVAPGRINFLMPSGLALGTATVEVINHDGRRYSAAIPIEVVAPGMFSANGDGRGSAAATFLRIAADGARSEGFTFQIEGARPNIPLDLGPEGDQLYIIFFGTGFRAQTSVSATVGGAAVPVLAAVAQGQFDGLDQVAIGPLPRSLAGRGDVDVVFTFNGVLSNTVTIGIR